MAQIGVARAGYLKKIRDALTARTQTPKAGLRLVPRRGGATGGGHNGQRGNGYRQSSTLKPGTRLKWASRVATVQSCSTASAAIHRSFSGIGAPARAIAPRNRA